MSGLAAIVRAIDAINNHIGKAIAWLTLLIVLDQFVIVVMRYVFSIGYIMMQESIWYLYGAMFMIGAGYTLLHDGHVRVDILYREASPRRKAVVNILGVIVFLIPICCLLIWLSWPYVLNSWRVFEGSIETGGLPFVYLLKTVIWVFVALVLLQGISLALRSALTLAGVDVPRAQKDQEASA